MEEGGYCCACGSRISCPSLISHLSLPVVQVVQLGQQVREAEAASASVDAGAAVALTAQKRALQDVAEAQAMQHTIAMEEVSGGGGAET